MSDCLFCKILKSEIPSKKVYEDQWVYCFEDINPEAPVHVLLIPKQHISSANELTEDNSWVVSKIFEAAAKVARQLGVAENGYRIVNNCGVDGGQTVQHLHFHMLAGRNLGWPPG
ncbi:MAG: histidine triad nucleotide-binding protein [Clostridia bacterium]|nr:histidine triad nucleotide-binding protein [Clostridia bacterium]